MNPKAAANLKPFRKGHDPRRNTKGRPIKLPKLDVLLADVLGEEEKGLTAARRILEALVEKAKAGDIRAAEVLLDRAYGKPKAYQDVTTQGKPIVGFQSIADVFWADVKEEIAKEDRGQA